MFNEKNYDLINKGRTGQLLEKFLGLANGSNLTDFEDRNLKTNQEKVSGLPDETMFIT